ncbi:hypothetical protein CRYUN_Cryun05aG0262500 [Craigia yunnanensis]
MCIQCSHTSFLSIVNRIHAFEVVCDDLGVLKRVIDDEGQGWLSPREPYEVKAWISQRRVMVVDSVTNGRTIFFTFGKKQVRSYFAFQVPEGFEMRVRLMFPGKIALVTCPPGYAYDKFSRPPNVPEGANVQREIELIGFEMPEDWTGLNFQSIMDEAEKIVTVCCLLDVWVTDSSKREKFAVAKKKYEKVVCFGINHVNPQTDEEGKVFLETRNLLHVNVAACFLKMRERRKSVAACNKMCYDFKLKLSLYLEDEMFYDFIGVHGKGYVQELKDIQNNHIVTK